VRRKISESRETGERNKRGFFWNSADMTSAPKGRVALSVGHGYAFSVLPASRGKAISSLKTDIYNRTKILRLGKYA